MMPTVFELIRDGKIPSRKIYEDNVCFAILDISPRAKGHTLVISKEVYPTVADAPEEVTGHMMEIVKKIDRKMRKVLNADGTNVIINNSPASGQEVPHLHIHVLPRFNGDGLSFFPPVQSYEDGEADKLLELLKI